MEDEFLNVVLNAVVKGKARWLVRTAGNRHTQVLGFPPFPADDAIRLAELQALRDGEKRAPAPHKGRLRGQHVW